jgi:hypothetical protein
VPGPKGDKGDTGATGPQGIPGPVGPQGIIEEAPLDGKTYGRKDAGWVVGGGIDFVKKAGDVMTGLLQLSGDPTAVLHAATKQYVDNKPSADVNKAYVDAADALRVLKAGDAMTGRLTAAGVTSAGDLYSYRAANVGYCFLGSTGTYYVGFDGSRYQMPSAPLQIGSPVDGGSAARVDWVGANYMPFGGGTIIGNLTVNGTLAAGAMSMSGSETFYLNAGSTVPQASAGPFMIQSAGGGNQAMITFHNAGAFACNFGMNANGNFYMGGWSHGSGVQYQFWTTRDFTGLGQYVTNGRLVFVADASTIGAMTEPYGGAVMTGYNYNSAYARWRYMQLLTTGWFTIGYA